MKLKRILALCLFMPLLMLSSYSCSSSDDDDWQDEESHIVGKWVLKEIGLYVEGEGEVTPYDNGCPGKDTHAEFNSNGSFYSVSHEIDEDCIPVEEEGVYWIDNDNLVLKLFPGTPNEQVVTERIKSLTSNRLHLTSTEMWDGQLIEIVTIFHKQ